MIMPTIIAAIANDNMNGVNINNAYDTLSLTMTSLAKKPAYVSHLTSGALKTLPIIHHVITLIA